MSDPDNGALAQARMRLARQIVAAARRVLGGEHGVTVLVHSARAADTPCVAMDTTLRTRGEMRAQLMHVVYQSLMADGATVDTVHELAVHEAAAAFKEEAVDGS